MRAITRLPVIVLFILALVFSLDLLLFPGRSITFDAHIHITTFSQFARALADGEFPVRWADGFANYGHPLPLFAHQTTSYLGGALTLLLGSPVRAYVGLVVLSAFASGWLLYRFLRLSVNQESALLGATLFMVAPYKLTNVYIRGALPEFFGLVFIPWILIGVHQAAVQRRWLGLVNVFFATSLLAFTHPMLLLISAVVIAPYVLFRTWPWRRSWRVLVGLASVALLGVASASAYILPLLYDIRFTNYGSAGPQFSESDFLGLRELVGESWGYFGSTHPGPRAETLTLGVIEVALLCVAIVTVIFWRKNQRARQAFPWFIVAGTSVILLLPVSGWLYTHVPLLGNIQFPWRMLSAWVFVPPILLAILAEQKKLFPFAAVVVVLALLWRLPQAYGKNYLDYSESHYAFTRANLHSNNMNTLWMGDPASYPRQAEKLQLISGKAQVEGSSLKNASRSYRVQATTPARFVEYTFYFPGWKVYVDGAETPIQFQDPNYRGILTFEVPEGAHEVRVVFEDTRVRTLGIAVTLGSLALALLGLGLERRHRWFLGTVS